jgi:hypothetical protein
LIKRALGQGQAMGQQLQISSWRGSHGERLWLSMLVDTMEEVARRAEPCDTETVEALRAQLALPAQIRFASAFSLRN